MSKPSRIFIEQVKILYERAPSVIPVNVVIACILAFILYDVVSHEYILVWLGCMVFLSLVRIVHVKYALSQDRFNENPKQLERLFMIMAFATAMTWASVFYLFYNKVDGEYLIFLVFALGGMSVGAVASMASSPITFFSYISPLTLVPAFVFAFRGGHVGYAMASMMFIYFMSIGTTYSQNYRLMRHMIALQFDKDALIQSLKVTNQHLEMANDKIMTLSNTDDLTQVSNRRHLDLTLNKEWGRAVRSSLPITFIMVDIDYFKAYNDTFGHQRGDECLQQIAGALKNLIKRPGDFVGRYGGEEFGIILPDTNIEGAMELMDELQRDILQMHIPTGNTAASYYVTISAGVACLVPNPDDNVYDLVKAADSALYEAKAKGRNRIEVAELNPVDIA